MAKDAPTRPVSATDHLFCVLLVEAAVEVVMAGGECCGSGVSAPMNTPSPDSLAHSMACVSVACDLEHRGSSHFNTWG